MTKSESKYFNTAGLMNQALIELLNRKKYEFITVKEICKKAGVHRSTFYLHYDKLDDLLYETIENINKNFVSYFKETDNTAVFEIQSQPIRNLILITPEYLLPYLNYVKEYKTVFRVCLKHPVLMQSTQKYKHLKETVLYPIFQRFRIEPLKQKYIAAYYIHGVIAIIDEWVDTGCREDVTTICDLIIQCVRPIV